MQFLKQEGLMLLRKPIPMQVNAVPALVDFVKREHSKDKDSEEALVEHSVFRIWRCRCVDGWSVRGAGEQIGLPLEEARSKTWSC